jgi:NADH-quinone oxidoreductase subunit E
MKEKVSEIIQKYNTDKSFLVPILQDVQKEFNYLPREALDAVSTILDLPLSRIFELATFYKAFSLTPRGRHQLASAWERPATCAVQPCCRKASNGD